MERNDFLPLLQLAARPLEQKLACERVLAALLREALAELFFTNAGLLMAYIHAGQASIIEDIVASSAERSLKPGVLRYGGDAQIQADWGEAPTVAMAMELSHPDFTIYFRIVFDARTVGVDMDSILFHAGVAPGADLPARLAAALAEARLPAA